MMESFVRRIRARGRELGLQDVGVTHPDPSGHMELYRRWIEAGHHGEMGYLARPDAVERRGDLRMTMEAVRSVVVVAQDYYQEDPPGVPEDPSRGVVARYARGEDYHDVLKARLEELLEWIRRRAREEGVAEDVQGLAYVDTGPILERELAQRAGLGWFGKNTMLIHPRRGSYFFLGLLLLDLHLPADEPFEADHCGSCRACLDACPTGALLGRDETGAPVMDARRCISYLTIEKKGAAPEDLRSGLGNRIFGCDICQEVCPWNVKFAEPAQEPAYRARSLPRGAGGGGGDAAAGAGSGAGKLSDTDGPELVELMTLTGQEFGLRFSGSPIKRAKRGGLLRNVAVALGNWRSPDSLEKLVAAVEDPDPLVRGHAAWALGQILARVGIPGDAGFEVAEALLFRLHEEDDPWVEGELERALRG